MKKQITITQKETKVIDVEVPSFHKQYGYYIAITDHSIIKVWPEPVLISMKLSSDSEIYNKAIEEVIQYPMEASTKEEFEAAFNNIIKCLTEQYQLSINMLDPNAIAPQQAEGQEAQAAEAEQTEQATEETGEAVAVE
jgi:hypothetical protein